jgi:tetratricopeptide (TPR) repeat protein
MNRVGKVVLVLGAMSALAVSGCKKEPTPAEIHKTKGNALLNESKWTEAAEEFRLSLEADPKQEKLWEKRAYAHMQAGDMDAADAAILKLLDFRTETDKKAEVYRNLASLYMQKNNWEKAEKYFNEAIAIDPKDDVSLAWIAEIYSQKGGARNMKQLAEPAMLDKAIEYYDRVIAVKPELPNTYLNKRIVMAKYMEYVRLQKEAKEQEARINYKDKKAAAEATAAAVKHQERIDQLKVEFEELTKKFSEAAKAAKAAGAAPGAATAAGTKP